MPSRGWWALYAEHTINMNPSFFPLILHSKRVGQLSFLFQVRVNTITGINLVCLLLIHVVIHGGMAIKVCISSCKIDFCWGAYYNTKNAWHPMISNYRYHKNFEKISNYHYDKNLEQKIRDDTMTFLSWTQSFWFQIWISGAIFKSAINLKIKMSSKNWQHMIRIIYLSFNKLMERSHQTLVQHIVLMQTWFSAPPMSSVATTGTYSSFSWLMVTWTSLVSY